MGEYIPTVDAGDIGFDAAILIVELPKASLKSANVGAGGTAKDISLLKPGRAFTAAAGLDGMPPAAFQGRCGGGANVGS